MKSLIAIIVLSVSLAFPAGAQNYGYGFNPGYQRNGNEMLQQQLQQQEMQRMHQERMLQDQMRQQEMNNLYQQQRTDQIMNNSRRPMMPGLGF